MAYKFAKKPQQTLNDSLSSVKSTERPIRYASSSPKSGEPEDGKKMIGYRIAIGALAVILVAISALYFNMHSQQVADYELLTVERNEIHLNLTNLSADFDKLEVTNDKLSEELAAERQHADSVITALKKERSFNYAKLKKYEKELGTLRTVMEGYLKQIDSLNSLNQELITQNVSFKKKITSTELRAEKAEELAKKLNAQVKKGERLSAQNITMSTLSSKGRYVSRAKKAEKLSVNFTISPNPIAKKGNTTIYTRVISPDGFILTTDEVPTFKFNGKPVTYSSSRDVDYQGKVLPVTIFFTGSGFVDGLYKVELYNENALIGSADVKIE